MHYIVFDLEATCWGQQLINRKQEVIEIGAIKINPYGEDLGTFHRYVKPTLHPRLSYYCQELTGIEQTSVDRASTFDEVFEEFLDWTEIYTNQTLLVAWGEGDRRILKDNCEIFDLNLFWTEHYFDVKSAYRALKRLPAKAGLKKALRLEGMEFEGEAHRAMDDALNLLRIFNAHLDEWQI